MSETVTVREEQTETTGKNDIITYDLFGRRSIFSSVEELTEDNVIDEITSALSIHVQNLLEEERLYWYRRGNQPVLKRVKTRNVYVLNKVIENHAEEIVAFKNGWFMTNPCFYTARDAESQEKVDKLNEYLYRSGKLDADNETVDWFHTTGLGYIFVEPNDDEDLDEIPFRAYALRPMQAFVVKSMTPGNKPVYAANVVVKDRRIYLDVYTKSMVFRLNGTYDEEKATQYPDRAVSAIQVIDVKPNVLGEIPIIEYTYNSTCMAAFEPVVGLLDTINNIRSNQSDGIEQFIQSLLVITNADLEDETTASEIKRQGMLLIRSTSELAAKVELLSEQLDQTQTQTYIDSLLQNMFAICGMPNRNEGGSTYNTTGAAALASYGFYQADSFARNTEDLFRKSNRQFDRIILKILDQKGLLTGLSVNDFELHFDRNETVNIQAKAQAFQTLMAGGMHPQLAMSKSGISNDPVSDVKMSEDWIRLRWGNPNAEPVMPNNPNETVAGNNAGGENPEAQGDPANNQGGDAQPDADNQGSTWIEGYWQKRS